MRHKDSIDDVKSKIVSSVEIVIEQSWVLAAKIRNQQK